MVTKDWLASAGPRFLTTAVAARLWPVVPVDGVATELIVRSGRGWVTTTAPLAASLFEVLASAMAPVEFALTTTK